MNPLIEFGIKHEHFGINQLKPNFPIRFFIENGLEIRRINEKA